MYTDKPAMYSGEGGCCPVITQDRDSGAEAGYIANIQDMATAGFKYFNCKGIKKIAVWTRGYIKGVFEVRLAWDGDCIAKVPVQFSNVWEESQAGITIPDGIWPVYLTFRGEGSGSLKAFALY